MGLNVGMDTISKLEECHENKENGSAFIVRISNWPRFGRER